MVACFVAGPAVFWIRDECMVNVCKLLLNIDVVFRKLTSRGLHEGQRG